MFAINPLGKPRYLYGENNIGFVSEYHTGVRFSASLNANVLICFMLGDLYNSHLLILHKTSSEMWLIIRTCK